MASPMTAQTDRIEIVPYDAGWPAAFEAEAVRIRVALGSMALRIDHNGSTSIHGLRAKPIIDIQVSVAALQPLTAYGAPLEDIGYSHVPHPDDAFCPFFHRPPQWPHSHHVHVVEYGGPEERRTLAFRDYLRDHHELAHEYEELKLHLAAQWVGVSREQRETYSESKSDFIARVVALALKSGYPAAVVRTGSH
jgi:GrpB-like predicted nucleotidyltransferase (UPF0157 family)